MQLLRDRYIEELEKIKLRLQLPDEAEGKHPEPPPPKHTPDVVQLTTSNLPGVNWGEVGGTTPSAPPLRPPAQDLGFPEEDFSLLTGDFSRLSTGIDLLTGPPASAVTTTPLPTFQTYGCAHSVVAL